ncbi:MAG: CPBP family intramembrane metalloprotease, partial [Alphaproteobacteria bacterium]|nr:CPBP family intramembrane metalloprotease [Alphaproteobacteria bacterium]
MAAIANLFLGEDRRLRHIWRAAIWAVLVFAALPPLLGLGAEPIFKRLGLAQTLNPGAIAFVEAFYFVTAFIATLPFALYERRSPFSYGLTPSRALDAPLWDGLFVGVAMAGGVMAGMIWLGGMQVHGLATTGQALLLSTLGWIGANMCVGFAEEFWFRSYLLQSLWRSLTFWPGALIVAAGFAAIHYFNKPGENIVDVITLVAFSLLCSYGVLRTGTLWFAVGLHAAFDFMQLFVIGTKNGGQLPVGRLLDATFQGPAWLTGGSLGTEASYLMYPAFVLA